MCERICMLLNTNCSPGHPFAISTYPKLIHITIFNQKKYFIGKQLRLEAATAHLHLYKFRLSANLYVIIQNEIKKTILTSLYFQNTRL